MSSWEAIWYYMIRIKKHTRQSSSVMKSNKKSTMVRLNSNGNRRLETEILFNNTTWSTNRGVSTRNAFQKLPAWNGKSINRSTSYPLASQKCSATVKPALLQDGPNATLRSETLRRNCVRCHNRKRWCKKSSKKVQNVCDDGCIKHGSDFRCVCDAGHTVQFN